MSNFRNDTMKGVFILGMHRSGTSALTRLMNIMGMQLGKDLLGAKEGNEAGHWEPMKVIDLNERVLAALGRTWSDPREMDIGWLEQREIRALIPEARLLLEAEYLQHPLWAIKDPRLSRLLPFWTAALSDAEVATSSQRAILAVRHPWEVASSLCKRDGMPLSQGLLLWLQHTNEALHASHGMKRVVVAYDNLLKDWRTEIERIDRNLELGLSQSSSSSNFGDRDEMAGIFLDGRLRHENVESADVPVPEDLLSLYGKLRVAESEEDILVVAEQSNLIARSASVHSAAISDIYVHRERLRYRVLELEAGAAEVLASRTIEREAELYRDISRISGHLERADWVNGELDRRCGELEQENRCLKHELQVLKTAIQDREREATDIERNVVLLQEERARLEHELISLKQQQERVARTWCGRVARLLNRGDGDRNE